MDYSGMLSYLQNLLSTQQGTNSTQFNQNLGYNQQQLAQQGTQFDTTSSLAKQLQMWNEQYQTKQAQTALEQQNYERTLPQTTLTNQLAAATVPTSAQSSSQSKTASNPLWTFAYTGASGAGKGTSNDKQSLIDYYNWLRS